MYTLNLFAFDQATPKPGCKYTDTYTEYVNVGQQSYGFVAGSNEQCGAAYYARQPYVFIPGIFVTVTILAIVYIKLRKKSK